MTDFLNDRPRRTHLGGRWVGGTEHASPGNVLFFNSPGSFPRPPFLGIMSHSERILASSIPFSSDEALQIGELLSLSLKMPENWKKKLFQPFTRFQLGMFYSVIYLFWKIWLVSLKLTLETGVNLKTSSSSGSNHFHTKLRGILWFTVYNQTDKPGKLKYSRN